jgi:predicted HTH domain antitoxin
MTISIPGDVLRSAGLSEEELRQEIAISLYKRGATLAQAARIADLSLLEFQKLLASQDVPVHYGVQEFEEDLETLRELGQL